MDMVEVDFLAEGKIVKVGELILVGTKKNEVEQKSAEKIYTIG